MSVDVVVCAYDENLHWLWPLQEKATRAFVYDKWDGPPEDPFHRLNIFYDDGVILIPLPDVGKNDHAYLHHIVEHYDHLADWTVFLTGAPSESDLRGTALESALRIGDSLRVPRLWRGRDWGPDGRIRWASMTDVPDANGTNWADRHASGKITPATLSFVEWMRKFVGFDPDGPDWPGYHPGALLAVPKRAITYLPRAFYERLGEQVSHSVEPEEGHYMERAWVVIFTGLARYQPEESTVCAIG